MPNTYTEREVAQIIERAVVRQEEARRRQGKGGLSLDELEKMGHEVGIDPEFLRAAAAEIDAGAGERESHTTATHNHVERWTAGPLQTYDWEDAVDGLRQRLGTDYGPMYGRADSGKVIESGATKTWEHTSGLGVHTRLTVSERGERTRIRLDQQVGSASPPVESVLLGMMSMLLLGPLAVFVGNALFTGTLALVTSVALGLVLLAAASFAIYKADVKWRKKKHRRLEDLADDLARDLAPDPAVTARAAAPALGAPARPALDLDALDVVAPGTPQPTRRRDRS